MTNFDKFVHDPLVRRILRAHIKSNTKLKKSKPEFGVYRFYCYVCIAASSETAARQILDKSAVLAPAKLRLERIDREDDLFFSAEPQRFLHPKGFSRILGGRNREIEALFTCAQTVNVLLSAIRTALAEPASFPRVPKLEQTEERLVEFCWDFTFDTEDCDKNIRSYYFLRYPKLRDMLIELRQKWKENVDERAVGVSPCIRAE